MVNDFLINVNPFVTNLLKNEIGLTLVHYLSIILINFISYAYVFAKLYKVLCFSKLTFDWLPMINPYVWPFSFFKLVTDPYFKIWAKILPSVKFEKRSVDISAIIALESLNTIVFLLVVLANEFLVILEETEQVLLS
jgi:uncharacterized protein YggT (Ycf19 family)|tara:strand:- start:55 stop:465 length:411 start_codon:yes stop_codon:yes gene_type:complete